MSVGIIVKNYDHYNRTLGMHIKSKEHYDRVCKEDNWVSFEQAQEIADKAKTNKIKPYKVSRESEEIIRYANQIKDKKGNLKLGDVVINKLIEKKAINKKVPEYMKMPSAYSKKGGFA